MSQATPECKTLNAARGAAASHRPDRNRRRGPRRAQGSAASAASRAGRPGISQAEAGGHVSGRVTAASRASRHPAPPANPYSIARARFRLLPGGHRAGGPGGPGPRRARWLQVPCARTGALLANTPWRGRRLDRHREDVTTYRGRPRAGRFPASPLTPAAADCPARGTGVLAPPGARNGNSSCSDACSGLRAAVAPARGLALESPGSGGARSPPDSRGWQRLQNREKPSS